ncbi:large conductance mechanosensitive channel protein MscL [Formosa sp. A9]|uniref:large conductance mechanosensitive channel protein MscL n=1 Tax=Formosa sp. A9 TaxID=3442641 RepID=UPI003EBBC875
MKLIKEFQEFAVKGNMIDMAVGIIIGASFNKVIDVLVKQVFMPPLSLLSEGIHFQDKVWVLRDEIKDASGAVITEAVTVGYGALIEALLDFLIIGFTVFLVVKFMNRLRKKSQDPKDKTVETPKDIQLLTNINESLKVQTELLKQQTK